MPHVHQYLYSKREARDQFHWTSSHVAQRNGDRYRATIRDGRDVPLKMFVCLPNEGEIDAVAIDLRPVESSRNIRLFSALRVAVVPLASLDALGGVTALWRTLDAAQRTEQPGDVELSVLPPAEHAFASEEVLRVFCALASNGAASGALDVVEALLDALPSPMLATIECTSTPGSDGWTARLTRHDDATIDPSNVVGTPDELPSLFAWLRATTAAWSDLAVLSATLDGHDRAWSALSTLWRMTRRTTSLPVTLAQRVEHIRSAAIEAFVASGARLELDRSAPHDALVAFAADAIERELARPSQLIAFARAMMKHAGPDLLGEALVTLGERATPNATLASVCLRAVVARASVGDEEVRSAIADASTHIAPLLRDSLRMLIADRGGARAAFVSALSNPSPAPTPPCLTAAVLDLHRHPDDAVALVELALDAGGCALPSWAARLLVVVARRHEENARGAGELLARVHEATSTSDEDRKSHIAKLPRRAQEAYRKHAAKQQTAPSEDAPIVREMSRSLRVLARAGHIIAGAALGFVVALLFFAHPVSPDAVPSLRTQRRCIAEPPTASPAPTETSSAPTLSSAPERRDDPDVLLSHAEAVPPPHDGSDVSPSHAEAAPPSRDVPATPRQRGHARGNEHHDTNRNSRSNGGGA